MDEISKSYVLHKDYKLLEFDKLVNSWPGVIWDHLTLLKWVKKINQKTFHTVQWCQNREPFKNNINEILPNFDPPPPSSGETGHTFYPLYCPWSSDPFRTFILPPSSCPSSYWTTPEKRETTRFLGGFYQLPPNPSGWDSNLSSCLITLGKNGQFLFDWSILWVKKPLKILRYLHHVTKKYENKFS